ncbi:hypothetical protein VFPPC_18106 [Pochonia chlamydosporia 170]|uniref:Uncharacterized protein n=1 Tax=Pochonia chlamydosporia 170 TaxID=1380566 RepID=A0A219APJ3_METCM|nr:hypothetical protein VFPPC_18106 [Pochonia chlamydosporia 170]OWT42693.1 hypothetical protein VFPPC_18106 [Pochonia chlamydosporia 170]
MMSKEALKKGFSLPAGICFLEGPSQFVPAVLGARCSGWPFLYLCCLLSPVITSITAECKEPWSRCWCQPCRRNVSEVCFDERGIGDGNLDAVVSITVALILICPHPAIFCAVPQVSVQQETAYRCCYFLETCNWTLRCPSHKIQDQEYFIYVAIVGIIFLRAGFPHSAALKVPFDCQAARCGHGGIHVWRHGPVDPGMDHDTWRWQDSSPYIGARSW